jgi:two-component system sensor histidine kinase BaeS
VAAKYSDSGRSIAVEMPDGLPAVPGDPVRLEQALTNLVDNAVRFSGKDAPVWIRGAVSGNSVTISVADKGQGIAEDDLPMVWDRFFRIEKSRSRKDGGAGLGLSITREIVQAHNGTVNAESVVGQGSVFSFTLPL